MRIPSSCLALVAALSSATGHSQTVASLFDLPLEALINVKVETPSKRSQSLSNAAGVASVFSRDEVAMFGGRNLADVLGRITGVQPHTSAYQMSSLTVRNDAPSVNNNHVLILLNGMPLNREGYLGGLFNHIMLTSIPLDAIQQIEVVRGPGSVLYGSNAFAGVINIITRDESSVENRVALSGGSFDTRMGEVTLAEAGEDWQLAGYLQTFDSEGERLQSGLPSGENFTFDQGLHAPGGIVTANLGGMRLNLYRGSSEFDQRRGTLLSPFEGETSVEKRYANLGYDYALNTEWLMKVDAGIMQSKPFVQSDPVNHIDYAFDDRHYEIQMHGTFSGGLHWISGMARDEYRGTIDPVLVPKWSYGSWSGFSEVQYQWAQTRIIAGLQLNKAENIDLDVVPRVGLIHSLSDHTGVKLMHGQAFRAPAIGETAINAPILLGLFQLRGNPDLEHEEASTTDLQFFYDNQMTRLAATAFRNVQDDLIVRAMRDNIITFVNQGELRIRGLELEGKQTLADAWYMTGSVTWQENENGMDVKDTTLQPHVIAKFGIGYRGERWSAGMFNSHVAARPDSVVVVPERVVVNPPAKAYDLLSFNINTRIPELADAQIELYFDNLLGEEIYRPMIPGTGLVSNTEGYRLRRYVQLGVALPL